MESAKPNVRGTRRFLYIVSILVAVGVIAFLVYSFIQHQHLTSQIKKIQAEVIAIDTDIAAAQKDSNYVKYAAARSIVADVK
jgi:uncharacterized protein YoxC